MRPPLGPKSTLNLLSGTLPMKASLPQNEPKWLKKWEEIGLDSEIRQSPKGKRIYVLHDGPPYANGALHEDRQELAISGSLPALRCGVGEFEGSCPNRY